MKHSEWKLDRCPHGKFRWMRWVWQDHHSIEDSEPEYSRCACKKCREE